MAVYKLFKIIRFVLLCIVKLPSQSGHPCKADVSLKLAGLCLFRLFVCNEPL